MPAWALYKVVGPDGRITYTDRPPAATAKPLSGALPSEAQGDGRAVLPYALQQPAAKFPVVIYTRSACAPCDSGRALLKARGVPFTEWTVNTPEDSRQFSRRENTDTLPTLRVGQQQIRGFLASEWHSYLDMAGYPSTSVLPADYNWPSAKALVQPQAPSPAAPDTAAPTEPSVAPTPSGGFRF